MKYYGVRGQSLDWFESYLSDRTQYVQYKGISSDMQCITCVVTQGSVLGHQLFIIYTNNLPLSLTYTKAILFADDTTLCAYSKQPDELYYKLIIIWIAYVTGSRLINCHYILPKPITCFSRMDSIMLTRALVFVLVLIRFNGKML